MELSRMLGRTIGIYLLVVSLAMLLRMQDFMSWVTGLLHDEPLLFVTGFFSLILGTLLVINHNLWEWHWRTLVTLVGWLVFLKSLCILLCPESMKSLAQLFLQHSQFAYLIAGVDLALALLFCYFGFRRET